MILPDLYNHFEEEEIDFKEWATSWYYIIIYINIFIYYKYI